ncbi:hypothetical protein B4119_0057 [Parageobacillus caldoxylosilyticus]|uniref:Uncharacterized protein n=1 Tax=Saccharococcus caldoxylosilyticus TaxID=81408 RepID=A0A150L1M2_9BACL|nr:hypothetical protein B4119_0057 [Parageobacillus caldoxylosilyticus]
MTEEKHRNPWIQSAKYETPIYIYIVFSIFATPMEDFTNQI